MSTNKTIIEIAQKIATHIAKIDGYKKDLVALEDTRGFITVSFRGEDGAERTHGINFGWERNSDDRERYTIAKILHAEAKRLIMQRIRDLEDELVALVDKIKQ